MGETRDLGVYVHWPFCRSKCPYCDFNSHAAPAPDQGRWQAAYERALAVAATETTNARVTSVYFGGGTPSLMAPATVAAILGAVRRHWAVADDLEVSLEANPTAAETVRLADFHRAGVNRLSIGVQSTDDTALAFLGRTHDAAAGRAAVARARGIFPRVSLDLMFGWPEHRIEDWRRQLDEALALSCGHLSLYQLTIEDGTAFAQRGVAPVDGDTSADLYDAAHETLTRAGFTAYEVSNFSLPGHECRHNLAIWRGGDYLGIGPGAHGRLTRGRATWEGTEGIRSPADWLADVEGGGDGLAQRTVIAVSERRTELLLTGLRLAEGVERGRFRSLAGTWPEDGVAADALAELIDGGFLVGDAVALRATADGLRCLDAVLRRLLA